MKTIYIFLLLTGISLTLSGQDIESLKTKLTKADLTSHERIEILNLLSRSLTYIDAIEALENANLALQLSTAIDNQIGIADAYRNLASIYSYNESYYISMEYLQRALDIFSSKGDSVGIANCYISLGHTYRRLQNRIEEVNYHKKSYEIFTRLGIAERKGVTSHNLGESYYNTKEFDKSRRLTKLSIRINDSLQNQAVLSACYKVMGLLDLSAHKLDSAEYYFQQVILLSQNLGLNSQKIATAESMLQLANIYKLKKKYDQELNYLLRAADFTKDNNLAVHLQQSYEQLITYFLERDDLKKVQEYRQAYQSISETVYQKQLADRNNLSTSVIQVHELSKVKKELEATALQQAQRIKNRNTILLFAGLGTLLLVWLIMLLFKRSKKLKYQNQLIDSQNQKLEELNSTKDKFFSIVAHDLKSPLNSLSSFSSLLISHYDHLSKEEILKMAGQLKTSVNNTIKMADNLITWAQIQMNDIKRVEKTLDIKEITTSIYSVYQDIALNKGVNLGYSIDSSLFIAGDKDQIEFIIRNLVNNAIKFTNTGGDVNMTVRPVNNDEIEIAVSDTGVGIPADTVSKLFTLSKKHSTPGTAGEKGTGLGLMLSYEFVRLNSGRIEVDSIVGQGTIFKVIFNSKNK